MKKMRDDLEKMHDDLKKMQDYLKKQYAWNQGIPPEIRPTREQREKAEPMLEDPSKSFYHFAVAGHAGSGRSSLVNAFRGYKDKDKGAAKVGINETTMDIKRYPDRSSIFQNFVWYDIPGAGTQANRWWQYFTDKGLFIFDFIIVCWKDRIMETDIQILTSCEKMEVPIPTFLVRTNSQTHIHCLKLSEEITKEEAKEKLIKETSETVKKTLQACNYNDPNKKAYIIDRFILGKVVSDLTEKFRSKKDIITDDDIREMAENVEGAIDEGDLLIGLLRTAKERRC